MNPGAKLGLDQAAPTAAAKQAAKDSEPRTPGLGELFEKFGRFLEDLKKKKVTPSMALAYMLNFYYENEDEDVRVNFMLLDNRLFAYRIRNNEVVKEIIFYTVDGLEFGFRQRAYYGYDLKTKRYGKLGFFIDHLARAEVYEG